MGKYFYIYKKLIKKIGARGAQFTYCESPLPFLCAPCHAQS